MQAVDVIFSALGVTKNGVFTVFQQIFSRYMVLYGVLPYVSHANPCIWVTCLCWSITEVVRFSFYSIKTLDVDLNSSTLANLIGTLRYSTFIVLYPVGVTGELFCFYSAWQHFSSLKVEHRPVPFSITLPNAWNLSFDWELFVRVGVPLLYIACFPGLYMHMWT